MKILSTWCRTRIALLALALSVLVFIPKTLFAWGGFFLMPENRLRLAATYGAFRISHDRFPETYASRWAFPAGFLAQLKVKGFPVLISVRHLSQEKKAGTQPPGSPSSCSTTWQQTIFNLGVGTGGGRAGRFQSQVGFGLSIHRIKEPSPFLVMGKCSSTATGFFIMTEVEYFLVPRVSLGWQFELSSAGAQKTAAFEANSVGGLYFGGTINVYAF